MPSTRMWLNAGALTLGVGAAMVAGAAVASADTGSSGSHSANADTSTSHSAAPAKGKSARTAASKPKGSGADRTADTAAAASARVAVSSRITATSAIQPKAANSSSVAAESTTTPSIVPSASLSTPTPNQLLGGLAEFGHNLYLTVSNQIIGAQTNLEILRDDLANVLGISRVTVTNPGVYGNPTQNKQYFVPMRDFVSGALATVAMAYGQLTGSTPDLQGFIDKALTTDSLGYPGYKIYRGLDTDSFVLWTDSYELLQDKGVRVITHPYSPEQQSKAINDLVAGLQDPTKVVIVPVEGAVTGQTGVSEKIVVVLGYDTNRNIVTINDPTRTDGQGLEVGLDDFLTGWSRNEYDLVTVQLAASSSTPQPAPATKLVWSLPAPDQIGQALQGAGKSIALAIVHQIEGAQANLADLANDLSYTFGIKDPTAAPPAPGDIEVGNYAANLRYWYYQGNYDTCAIMATAAIVGQLKGILPPDLGQVVYGQATSTASGQYPGQKIFEPNGQPGTALHWGVSNTDVVKLLNMNGLNADWTTYLKSQGNVALDAMTAALNQKQGVIVSVASNVIYNAYTRAYFDETREQPGPEGVKSDHSVVVISVDPGKKIVYLNDSALQNGKGFPVPLDEFMKAWRYSDYSLITAELPAT
ncbi:hypothetical protein [Mycobacterium sp. EPa45]|uniref:hypothetical protein n=1 Tax=Mycobacterium sp. EPa45 TaxID=1545728 RepID=UPI00118757F0|nr:hypothetical protein [Mycobacterium sp. EPa45]